jgi:hypothetical protein
MWKKGSALLLAGTLVLTGCAGEASLVRDAIVTTMEKPNYDYQGTVKLTGDLDKLPELLGEPADKEGAALLEALKAGVTVTGSQLDLENTRAVFEVNDDKLLRDNGLWTGDSKASVELILAGEDLYAKSPLDSKYFFVSGNPASDLAMLGVTEDVDVAKLKEYQDKINDLTIEFIKNYVAKYGYKLNNVENLGAATVELPNGEKAETTHIAIKLDAKELVNMFFYTANDAVANEEVKAFAIDLMVLSTSLQEEMFPEAERTTEAEKRAMAEEMVTEGLESAKAWLAEVGTEYTPDKVVEEMKAAGLLAIDWNVEFYVTEDKIPVQQVSELSVTIQDETMDAPLTLGLSADQYTYNYEKATKYDIPTEADGVSLEQLYEDEKAINAFSDKGFFRHFVQSMVDDYKLQKEWELEWEKELESLEEAEESVTQ